MVGEGSVAQANAGVSVLLLSLSVQVVVVVVVVGGGELGAGWGFRGFSWFGALVGGGIPPSPRRAPCAASILLFLSILCLYVRSLVMKAVGKGDWRKFLAAESRSRLSSELAILARTRFGLRGMTSWRGMRRWGSRWDTT